MARTIDSRTVGRYLRTYLAAPRYPRERRIRLTAADGVGLTGWALPGPPDAPATVVLVHGFANWSRSPRIHAFAHLLARRAHVVVPDLRGHGWSDGSCTIGRDEPLDVAAAVAAAPEDLPVVTVGVSLGAGAVLLHAADQPRSVTAVVGVSAPAYWEREGGEGAYRIARLVMSGVGRTALARLTRTRIGSWEGRTDPVDVIARIAPTPIVLVHDPDDWYFDERHARLLYEAAGEPKQVWWQPGGGHGTDLLGPELAQRILGLTEPG